MEAQVPKGTQTSELYRVNNIPDRFNNPAQLIQDPDGQQCYFPGNPVVSCINAPSSTETHNHIDNASNSFKGYSEKKTHPLYRTTAMDYGGKHPNVHTMPTVYHAKSTGFTEHLGKTGMYRNQGFNTELPGSKHV